jgi:hypothetical protein
VADPPPIPLTTPEMDGVYDLPYARAPHPAYGDAKIPAWDMIRFSVNIMRGCFGGCSFCSITEHEGRIIQSRSEELDPARDRGDPRQGRGLHRRHLRHRRPDRQHVPHGLQGPEDRERSAGGRPASSDICKNLNTDHDAADPALPQGARDSRGQEDPYRLGPALRPRGRSPAYVKELVTHHVGGYLKIAPEHTEAGPLSKMMKPGMGAYDRFKQLFDRYSPRRRARKYLIPYFIAAHPGTDR